MSTFMKRNALFGSAAMFSLLAVLHAPTSLAGEGHSEHEQHAAESAAPDASDTARRSVEGLATGQQMDHGAMDHGDMKHDGMNHENMMDKHGGTEAEAGSNHDH